MEVIDLGTERAVLPSRHIDFLDVIRGVAIALVFAIHAVRYTFGYATLGWDGWWRDFGGTARSFYLFLPLTIGWSGVAVFFVVSGFCIHLSFQRSKSKSNFDFFIRRIFRIFPPYLIALLIFSFCYPWHQIDFQKPSNGAWFFSHLFLVHNFSADTFYRINPAFWSIAVEFQLYLLYPLLCAIAHRYGWKFAIGATAVVEIAMRVTNGLVEAFNQSTFGNSGSPSLAPAFSGLPFFYWFSWSIGVAQAEAWLHEKPPVLSQYYAAPVFLFLALASNLFKPTASLSFLFFALCTASIIGYLLKYSAHIRWAPAFVRRHFAFAGEISYSVYLLHMPILMFVPGLVRACFPGVEIPLVFIGFVCLAAWFPVLWISWVFFRLVEIPSIGVGKWIVKKHV